jgi:hypothetical protein
MQTFQLPLDSSDQFPSLFDYMDNHEVELGVGSYGMSVTTLEEVFIKVAHATKTIEQQDQGAREGRRSSKNMKNSVHISEKNSGMYESKVLNHLYKYGCIYIYIYIYRGIHLYVYTHIYVMYIFKYMFIYHATKVDDVEAMGDGAIIMEEKKEKPLVTFEKVYTYKHYTYQKPLCAYINLDIYMYYIPRVGIAAAPG